MPRKPHRGWEGKPNYRWSKMISGVRHRVTCAELGIPKHQWTALDSAKVAAEHFAKIVPAVDPAQEIFKTINGVPFDEMKRVIDQATLFKRLIAAGPDAFDKEVDSSVVDDFIGVGPLEQDRRVELLGELSEKFGQKVETQYALTHHAAEFLKIERARAKKANTYGELADYITKLVDMIGSTIDVRTINEQTVTAINLKLRTKYKSTGTKKKVWGFFKRLVRHFWSERLIEMPRNLDEKKFVFKVTQKKVKRYDLAAVKLLLAKLPERLKLYACLALNCGMQGMDMACFTKSQLDTATWTITRKRTKTEEIEEVPEVSYKLWGLTVRLLKKHLSSHKTLALTSRTNTPLVVIEIDESGKRKRKDLIGLQWKRKALPIPLKAFRSIGATIIGDSKEYGRYYHHYLAHSAKSLADKHYVPPSDEFFAEIMAYVGKVLDM